MGFGDNSKFRDDSVGRRVGYFPDERNANLSPMGQQPAALAAILEWLSSGDYERTIFRVDGAAGTGKSALLGFLLERLIERHSQDYLFELHKDRGQKQWEATSNVILAAPTHKAAREAEGKLHPFGIHKDFETVARILKLEEEHCSKTGKQEFVQSEPPTWSSLVELVIVDENSMVNQYQFDKLCEAIDMVNHKRSIVGWHTPAKLLLVGDRRQLTPVGEPLNSSFTDPKIDSIELVDVLRHDGSILDLSCKVRAIPNGVPVFRTVGDGAQVLSHNNQNEFEWAYRAKVKEVFDNPDNSGDALNAVQAVAKTRARVSELSKLAREAIYGVNPPRFVVGELLVSTNAVKKYAVPGNAGLLAHSTVYMRLEGEREVMVEPKDAIADVKDLSDVYYRPIKCHALDVSFVHIRDPKTGKPKTATFTVVHEDDLYRFKQTLSILKKSITMRDCAKVRRKLWREVFYPFAAMNAPVESALAITVHRSQGSTIKTVFVDYDNIARTTRGGFDLNRTAYTAVTRASEQLVILDSRSKAS